ncbi:hypothetical protein ABW19_dt0210313 [Dactylella cylindrospora]|nr:hypothetical protein ABW19_dt0210313 [Dactylella cylindrospora]
MNERLVSGEYNNLRVQVRRHIFRSRRISVSREGEARKCPYDTYSEAAIASEGCLVMVDAEENVRMSIHRRALFSVGVCVGLDMGWKVITFHCFGGPLDILAETELSMG